MSDIVLASAHTSLTLFLVISDWRSRTSLAPAWITILLNLRLALASTFKFAKMSGALAPGKQWTMVAGVSIFTFRTIESPITRALSPGFSVGASLSGENLFDVLIGTEERCFDPRLCCLTVRIAACIELCSNANLPFSLNLALNDVSDQSCIFPIAAVFHLCFVHRKVLFTTIKRCD